MTFLDSLGEHNKIPDFMSEEDFDFYLKEFKNGGMRGPINWYRNIDKIGKLQKILMRKKYHLLHVLLWASTILWLNGV